MPVRAGAWQSHEFPNREPGRPVEARSDRVRSRADVAALRVSLDQLIHVTVQAGALAVPALECLLDAVPDTLRQAQRGRQPVGREPVFSSIASAARRPSPRKAAPSRARSVTGRPAPRWRSMNSGRDGP